MSLQRIQSVPLQEFRPGSDSAPVPPPSAGNSPSTGSNEQPFFRLDLRRSLQLHRGLALGFALAGIALAVGYAVMKWPVYTAQSQVYVQPVAPKVMGQGNESHWPYDAVTYDSFVQQQVEGATHPDVLINVLHKLGPGSWQRAGETEEAAAARLGRAVEVLRLGTSYQVEITAQAKDPELAAKIANALAAGIVERASREEKAGDTERMAILRDEQDRIQKELEADRAEQESLNSKLGIAAIGSTASNHYDDDINRLHEELVKARAAHDEAAARFISVDADHEASSKALNAEAEDIVSADPGLVSMKTSLNTHRAQLITQMANLTPNHPQYKQDAEELAQINASLDSTMKELRAKAAARLQQRMRTELDRTSGIEGRLNAQLGQLTGAAVSATPKLQRASDLATDILRLQNRLTSVGEQLHNLMLEDNVPGAAHLSVAAIAPAYPTIKGIVRKSVPMALGGIIFGILAALLANNLDSKVYIAADVEHVLGFAPMALLPDFGEVSPGVAEEHLLRLAATIQHASQSGSLKSCIFTSTGPGTGVSTVSTKVRTILEAMGRPCVLVDASGPLLSPQQTGFTGMGSHANPGQVASQRGSRSTALLQQLADETEAEESLVLTDTAPLPISAETEYLARYVDAAIVVVESGVTTRAQLREVADSLQRLNVGAVGFVLNRVGMKKADPAFRASVQAIDKHLRAQSRSTARQTERSQAAPSVPALPKAQTVAREEAIPALAEPQAAPQPAAETATRPAAHGLPELTAATPEPTPLPTRVSRIVREARIAQPETLPVSNLRSRQFVPPRQEVAKAEEPRIQMPPSPEPRVQEPRAQEPRIPEPRQPEQASVPEAVAPPQFAADARPEPTHETWERLTGSLNDLKPEPARADAGEPAEMPYKGATRIHDLRNLASSLGMKNLHKAPEAPEQVADLRPPVEPVYERPLYEHSYTTYTPAPLPPVQSDVPNTSPRRVTAQPEILPPTPPENEDKEQSRTSKRESSNDRRDSFDDVDILPSWHGQYKKR
ncbi:MAG: hypothetical protein P4K86_10230 [Terracidiphilus sp.]|nr:hypothetical protein [Terracidiphilus sp.]MDR3775541.1 hypothetical protein [Terracidiphilus sp.]